MELGKLKPKKGARHAKKRVGVNVCENEPSLLGVVVPSKVAYCELRSPLIHVSMRSMLPGSLTVPLMV